MGKEFDFEKLDGSENYHTWAFAVENYIAYKGLQGCISDPVTEKDAKNLTSCKAILGLSVNKCIYVHIQKCESARDVWTTLKKLYEDTGLTRKIGLLKSMITTKLEDHDNMQQYVDKIMSCANKLNGIGFKITDEWTGAILLAGLTEIYRPLIMGIEASASDFKADTIISKLLDAQPTTSKSNGETFFSKKGKNKKRSNGKNKSDKESRTCYNCGTKGHLKKECRAPKKESTDDKGKSSSANTAFTALSCKESVLQKDWYVDSGASSHMTPDGDILRNKRTPNVLKITSANDAKMDVKSEGDTRLTLDNKSIPMHNVLHVPDLAANLLSVSSMVSKGNSVIFDKNGCTIRNAEDMIVANCKPENGVYKFQESNEKCMFSSRPEKAYTWHRRLGHINHASLRKMRDGAVTGINFSDDDSDIKNCEVCCTGKMSRPPFKSSDTKTTSILETIHSDIAGPMETQSIGHARYILTFTDDFSKKVFVYFLKAKSEVLDTFIEFKNLVENQTGKQMKNVISNITEDDAEAPKMRGKSIKKLRTDNGREYLSNDFVKFCKANGIHHQLTNVYTPQQNGVAERMNRTLVEKAKCLLFDAKLPKCYWAEATNMAAYLINKSVNSTGIHTPDEIFFGKKPDLTNLKIFGSSVMVYVPKEKRKKWDQKAEKLIFVGYDDNTKGYRCINGDTRKLTISRDVKFLEDTSVPENVTIKMDEKLVVSPNLEDNQQSTDDSVIFIEDESSFETTSDDSTFEDPNDPDYEPSEESILNQETEGTSAQARRGNKKVKVNPLNLTHFAYFIEPQSYKEVNSDPDSEKWQAAMAEEMESHLVNNTWTLTDLPEGRKAINSKWVYKLKRDENGEIVRHKARLVAKGCAQKYGIDYNETFSPVVRYTSVRFLFALAVQKGLKCHQLDAITAFLHGEVTEEIYMQQPEGFHDGTQRVCKLNRAIYGLKQAGRLWNLKLDKALSNFGLKKCKMDPCIYYESNSKLLVAIYVDDFLIFYKEHNALVELQNFLNQKFRMKDVGKVACCLGMRVTQKNDQIWLDQERYINDILERFGMQDCKPVGTPSDTHQKLSVNMVTSENSLVGQLPFQEAVGSLLYLAQGSRPDISFAVNDVSRFNTKHTDIHWKAVKRIFRYLRGTINYKLKYSREGSTAMHCYSDSDWASDIDKRRSCAGQTIIMSNAAISWSSKRQCTVALSSTEAEYMALSSAVCDVIWTQQLAAEIDIKFQCKTKIYCDNESAIKLSLSDAFRPRTKHIDIRYHHLREKVECGVIDILHVPTEENVADMLTKPVTKQKQQSCSFGIGLK